MKVAGWAEAHYIDLMPHNPLGPICTAATAHLSMAVPNFSWMEVRISPTEDLRVSDDLISGQVITKAGRTEVSDRPGLGIDVNEDAIANSPMKPDSFLNARLHRRDGSVTNW